jgi:outer membrane protein OmpA-like peptidoglycan-associated protein
VVRYLSFLREVTTMQILYFQKSIITTLALSMLLLTGCQSVDPYTGQSQTSNATAGTAVGAIGGAAIGAIAGGGRGALIGGALGGLTGALVGSTVDKQNEELRRVLVGTGVQVQKQGNSIQLIMASDVTFKTNQADVRADFYPTLNSVAVVLKKYNQTSITITGFTDNVGTAAYNQELSERRAQSVGSYLVSQGISPNRINTQGRGERQPMASNATVQGRALNRRVEITLRPIS